MVACKSSFASGHFVGCRWLFFPPQDLACLYPTYAHSTDAVFEVDLGEPDLSRHPLLSLTSPYECLLRQGDLLFVPAGCPHRVENLEPSLAISANFVDGSNLAMVIDELKINSLIDPRAGELLATVTSKEFCSDMDKDQCDLEWEEFKRWPRTIRFKF